MSDEKPKGYKDLLVWRKGIELVKSIYQLTQRFPADERFGLTQQLRRSAVSVPCNIAEGQARHTTKEFIHSISNSEGSLAEVDTQVMIATELQYCIDPVKDHLNFVRAAALLGKRQPRARFLLCGDGTTPANRELFGAIRETGLLDRFRLLGSARQARPHRPPSPAC